MSNNIYLEALEEINFAIKNTDWVAKKSLKFIKKYEHKKWLGIGRHRVVFLNKNYVVKVPLGEMGLLDNERENKIYHFNKDLGRYAKCRLYDTILVMEYVSIPHNIYFKPDWVKYIDCSQVGYNRKNQLVAYDFAN